MMRRFFSVATAAVAPPRTASAHVALPRIAPTARMAAAPRVAEKVLAPVAGTTTTTTATVAGAAGVGERGVRKGSGGASRGGMRGRRKGLSVEVKNGNVDDAMRVMRQRMRDEGRPPRFFLPHVRHVKRSVERRLDHKARVRRTENRQLRQIIVQSIFYEKHGYDMKHEEKMRLIRGEKRRWTE